MGKAAIDGWQSVIRPAVLRGARLWPFNGQLAELSKLARCVLCETYPWEAYSHVGVRLGGSKRTQEHRQRASAPVLVWAKKWDVSFAPDARKALVNGFGLTKSGEDPFDSFIGLLGMIEVVDGRRNEGNASSTEVMRWEGWIFGQAARESFRRFWIVARLTPRKLKPQMSSILH